MLRINQLTVPVEPLADIVAIRAMLKKKYGIDEDELLGVRIIKKSLDARKKSQLFLHFKLDLDVKSEDRILSSSSDFTQVAASEPVNPLAGLSLPKPARHKPVIIGSGPAGMFVASVLARAGQPVIIVERGERVDQRLKTVGRLRREGVLDPESNYCYGEGGAGTFSDGKLTCGRNHPYIQYVFQEFVERGAPSEILYDAHPHMGTDYLLRIAVNMRTHLESIGTEFRFGERFLGFRSGGATAKYLVKLASSEEIPTDHLILAMGHSARETYENLLNMGFGIIPKPFAIGVRLEHPQDAINQLQYGSCSFLPAAEYKLAAHADNRGIWTFCMCPGGHLLPTMAEPEHLAINGMSYHARNSGFANAAIVVNIRREDFYLDHPLDGVKFQRQLEQKAFAAGGGNYHSPAQKLVDFLEGRSSRGKVESTYKPGVTLARMDELLPSYVVSSLRVAMGDFDKKIRGFIHPEALIVGLESKTSSPVSFPRDDSFQSLSHPGVYPCGEGAGFAGGIVSAALDGVRVGRAIVEALQ